jgi:RsiW-degrading membrane proteinase PrsW (M82 family)
MDKLSEAKAEPVYSTAYFIKEAIMSAFKPQPVENLPTNAVYQRRPSRSLSMYLVAGGVMVVIGCFLLFGDLWIQYIGLTMNCFTLPIVFLLWFLQNDRYDPEPISFVAYLFGWGAIAGLCSYVLNPILYPYLGEAGGALVEEPLKLVGIYLFARGKLFRTEINSHLDGMIYGAAVGAGFASLENVLYIFYGDYSSIPLAMLSRMTTVFMHIAWTAIAARTLGLALALRGDMKITDLIPGLIVVIPLHFLWNSVPEIMRGAIILPITLLVLFREVNMAVKDEESWGFKLVGPSEKRVRRRRSYEQTRRGR